MKVLSLVAAATLIAGCEVNLNTEGLSAREVKTFKVTGQPKWCSIHSTERSSCTPGIATRSKSRSRTRHGAIALDEIKIDAQQEGDKIVVRVTGPRAEHGVTIGMHISPTARSASRCRRMPTSMR
jgi:hypothetical protein